MNDHNDLINVDGAQQCLACGVSFKVFSDDENSLNFCPFCSSSSDKFTDRPDLEE
ncbi:hypothetical protein [Enterococcus sp. BWR-S5]|uniref:hypothetical protein n=1 Tax=Enterococcus sp. BWR-S5 TaxID=2787714 RepID=UPI001922DEE3|nr:hypothetical protein [Enterococcus sp. BWR-S5]MBL1227260.1 hypothetical protein [Enterococcus sp. BWR-S5]